MLALRAQVILIETLKAKGIFGHASKPLSTRELNWLGDFLSKSSLESKISFQQAHSPSWVLELTPT